jgi:transposase
MEREDGPVRFKFTARDRSRLAATLKRARDARLFRRLQAILLVADGTPVSEVARLAGASRQSVYNWLQHYAASRRAEALRDGARAGRPRAADDLTGERILEELRRDPLTLGYSTQVWTVALLARHLAERCGCAVSERTLRRRMRAAGLRWKRPRYVLTGRDEHAPQKKGR